MLANRGLTADRPPAVGSVEARTTRVACEDARAPVRGCLWMGTDASRWILHPWILHPWILHPWKICIVAAAAALNADRHACQRGHGGPCCRSPLHLRLGSHKAEGAPLKG